VRENIISQDKYINSFSVSSTARSLTSWVYAESSRRVGS
jgi:hypothetical protein